MRTRRLLPSLVDIHPFCYLTCFLLSGSPVVDGFIASPRHFTTIVGTFADQNSPLTWKPHDSHGLPTLLRQKNKDKMNIEKPSSQSLYNDDAFGLIFLTSLLALHDISFAFLFLALSFLGSATSVVTTRSERVITILPGFVAISSLATKSIALAFFPDLQETTLSLLPTKGLELGDEIFSNAWWIEAGLCLTSFVWAFCKAYALGNNNKGK